MLLAAATAGTAPAQEISFGGQIRPRFEFREPAFRRGLSSDSYTSMRARASLRATFERDISIFVQLQDVRLWGSEAHTLLDFSAKNFDLHQGFMEIGFGREASSWARIGRQATNFGGQRLVGAVDWEQQGRSFDGIRLGIAARKTLINVIGYVLGDATAPEIDNNAAFAGVYSVTNGVLGGELDLYGLYNGTSGADATNQGTVGARLGGRHSALTYRVEASYQFGERLGSDVSAFMVGARAGASLAGGAGQVVLWYDYLSGDNDQTDDETKVFDTLFATNHKFYGYADLFLSIPLDTDGLGLQDLALKAAYAPRSGLELKFDIHSFHLAQLGGLGSRHLGEEIDLTIDWIYTRNLTFTGGWSQVFHGSALRALGKLTEDLTFLYVMLNAEL